MTRKALLLTLLLPLLAIACGGDPNAGAKAKITAGDRIGAKSAFEARLADSPGDATAHAYLFVLCRYELTQGDPSKQDALTAQVIREYEWLADHFGLNKQFSDMERSLVASDRSRALYQEARDAVFGKQR